MRHHAFVLGFASIAIACSSTSSGSGGSGLLAIDTNTACSRLVDECKQPITKDQCAKTFGAVRVSQACIDKLNTATCDEIAQAGSDFDETCFPNCETPGSNTCNGDGTLTGCSDDGRTIVADCAAGCQASGSTYSGTCGKSFGAQTSDKDKCWCQ